MTRPVLRAPFLRWLPAMGAVMGAIGGFLLAVDLSQDAVAQFARLAALNELPERDMLAPLVAIVVGSVCWAALYLIWGKGGPLDATHTRQITVRRITMQSPSAASWPIAAVDTAPTPPRERSVPVDLNQPMSAFDPNSIPTVSFESIRRSGLRPIA